VTNLGIAGETVEGLLGRMDAVCSSMSGPDPDFIFLMTGINNIAMEDFSVTGPFREILENITSCFRHAKVVVQSILPVRLPWVKNERIAGINLSLKELAGQFAAAYLDLYGIFTDSDGAPVAGYLLEDGVHLSAKGYARWADAVEQFLK
jgi:lysophospholipase L1-like esterase